MKKIKIEAILAVLIAIFVLIELKGLMHYENSDENIYFYMGKLIAEGKVPYKDFFFAHPPLKIYANALLIKLFGANLLILKLIPLISTIISSIFIFKLMKREFGGLEGIAASSLFLFSYTIMSESTYATGINLTLMFAIIGIYLLYSKKYFLSGILFGFSAVTGLYSMIFVAVILIFLFLSSKNSMIRYLAGFSLIFLAVNLFFYIISGGYYLVSAYKYHLLKPKLEGNTLEIFWNVISKSPVLFSLAALFALNYSKKLQLISAMAIAYILFLLFANRIFNFYFVLLIPLLSVLAAYSLIRMAESTKMKNIILTAIFFMLGISALLTTIHLYTFDFADFKTAKEISSFVIENSAETSTIFGDDTSTPLIALYSGRKISYDMVDTNFMVFRSNLVALDSVIERMENNPPKYVIVRPLYNIGSFPEFSSYLNDNCVLVKSVKDVQWADFLVYDCSQS